jgi:hypothetical protein
MFLGQLIKNWIGMYIAESDGSSDCQFGGRLVQELGVPLFIVGQSVHGHVFIIALS